MKKIVLGICIAMIGVSVQSCRESTQAKTEEAVEAIGDDIKDGTRRAADKVKDGAKKVKREIDEEIHETDDQVNYEEVDTQ